MMLMYVDVKKNLKLKTTETITNEAKFSVHDMGYMPTIDYLSTWDEPTAPLKQASGLYKHSPFRHGVTVAVTNMKRPPDGRWQESGFRGRTLPVAR